MCFRYDYLKLQYVRDTCYAKYNVYLNKNSFSLKQSKITCVKHNNKIHSAGLYFKYMYKYRIKRVVITAFSRLQSSQASHVYIVLCYWIVNVKDECLLRLV